MPSLPVSVIICALNEEARILDAITTARQNDPAEVIVVEGGSVDRTYEIAKAHADKAFSVEQFGLGYKRAFGIEQASQPYALTLDADQVLEDGALATMIRELDEQGFTAIQASLQSVRHDTYWERAMGHNVHMSHSEPKETNMIGTPALFRTETLKQHNFDKTIAGSCDDTDLCYRLHKMGFRFGISSAVCLQKHRSSMTSTFRKFLWYGEGDFEFARKHPERAWSIFTHPVRNYIFRKTWHSLKSGEARYAPFFIFTGFVRHMGFYKGVLKYIFGQRTDSRIADRASDKDY